MPTKVSVVVPVYNPGPYIEPCIESLLAQTMSTDDLELVFVNDGSTDDSLERLRRYGRDHPHLKVISIPNSGWPGRPRNVGIDAACGEYVMFVDQDDQMDPEALERMYRIGSENGADVVLGKVTSDFRAVSHKLYRTQRPRCSVYTAQLLNSLTPHKMLRAEFLREQAIRYPEGRRRLEDQPFIVKAYFTASNVSIVADYVCYRYLRRPDNGNAGSVQIEPAGYYGNLTEVLDVIDAHTEPGPDRDGFYRRFLRIEMLGRLGSATSMQTTEKYRTSLLREIRSLIGQRFSPSVDAGLGTALRPQARLARTGTIEQLVAQADAIRSIRCEPVSTAVRATTDGFEVDLEFRLTQDGRPLWLEPNGSESWRLPAALIGGDAAVDDLRVEPAAEMPGDVIVRHRKSRDEWFLLDPLTARLAVTGELAEVIWSGTVRLPMDEVAGGGRPVPACTICSYGSRRSDWAERGELHSRALPHGAIVHVDDQGRSHAPLQQRSGHPCAQRRRANALAGGGARSHHRELGP